jgi:hypothetical protein
VPASLRSDYPTNPPLARVAASPEWVGEFTGIHREGGDMFTFVQKIRGIGLLDAVDYLADKYNVAS